MSLQWPLRKASPPSGVWGTQLEYKITVMNQHGQHPRQCNIRARSIYSIILSGLASCWKLWADNATVCRRLIITLRRKWSSQSSSSVSRLRKEGRACRPPFSFPPVTSLSGSLGKVFKCHILVCMSNKLFFFHSQNLLHPFPGSDNWPLMRSLFLLEIKVER